MTASVVSLCSGYGGLDDAAVAVFGGQVVAYAETDPAAIAALELVYPGVPNAGDITAAQWGALGLGSVDVLCAGFPCQPVSSAGKRKGAEDERWIWPDVARAVRELSPAWVVLENVDDLLVRDGGELIAEVIGDLRAAGYVGSWVCVKASDVGAAHERNRVFIVARRADVPGPVPGQSGWAHPFALAEGAGWAGVRPDLFDPEPAVGKWPRSGAWDAAAAWPRPVWTTRFPPEGPPGPLFPSPVASTPNDGESLASWDARRDRLAALGYNGNGMGVPLAIAVQRLAPRALPTPAARDVKGPCHPVGRVRPDGRVRGEDDLTLPDAVARFATPLAGDGNGSGRGGAGREGSGRLADQLLPTPRASARENRTRHRTPSQTTGEHGRYLSAEVLTLFGDPLAIDQGGDPGALFPTPTRANGNGNGENNRGEALLPGVAAALLPTPLADWDHAARPVAPARTHAGRDRGPRLADAVALLPTAVAQDAGAARSAGSPRLYGGTGKIGYTLTDRLAPRGEDNRFAGWGQYGAAVARWEIITGHPAPVPVQPAAVTPRRLRECAAETGLDGYAARAMIEAGLWGAQLDPRFSEWLMGIPPGRVTGVAGLSRNAKLRLIGNGVVTLQAASGVAVLAAELGWSG